MIYLTITSLVLNLYLMITNIKSAISDHKNNNSKMLKHYLILTFAWFLVAAINIVTALLSNPEINKIIKFIF